MKSPTKPVSFKVHGRHPYWRVLGLGVTALGLGILPGRAWADDLGPPPPNVLLLVDNSGSMEKKSGSTDYPLCRPGGSGSEKSRWIELVEVLTGSIPNDKYSCNEMKRDGTSFVNEFALSGVAPYDLGYTDPYHRPLSDGCQPGPGSMAGAANAYAFPAGAFGFKNWQNQQDCSFYQYPDGLLDSFKGHLRFGLMTFDSLINAGTGIGGSAQADPHTGVQGHWSYYVGNSKTGRPVGCGSDQAFEVGARNAAAPPWEGRMVAFGAPDEDPSQSNRNSWIQNILLTTRPFGATPINGMLDDARAFLWTDTAQDPLGSGADFGPKSDPFVVGGCRQNAIILLSDGEPNLELRPSCEAQGSPAGACPYVQRPEEIANSLSHGTGGSATPVFVIGFSLSAVTVNGQTKKCAEFQASDLTTACTASAMANDKALRSCCVLNQIAYEGKTDHAYFADSIVELRSAISGVLSKLATSATSRTLPVSAASNATGGGAYRFYTSFVPKSFELWRGVLERQRFVCKKQNGNGPFVAEAQTIDASQGDDFVSNVNFNRDSRTFYWVEGDNTSSGIQSRYSMRPDTATDNVSNYRGTQQKALTAALPGQISASALGLQANSGVCTGLDANTCRTRMIQWLVGLPNGTQYNRCLDPSSIACSLVGHIFHSTPQVVAPPNELLRDETYQTFRTLKATRPTVLYTSSNDGFLHAFRVSPPVTSRAQNELWAFMPPAVLPLVQTEYPPKRVDLLDGAPTIRDVPATLSGSTWRLERAAAGSRTGSTSWRTILLQSFGGSQGGYFAVDVTDPDPASTDGGPKFLWQLTTDGTGNPLFGNSGATPLITSLYFDDSGSGGGSPKEVAVAILPGGFGDIVPTTACDIATDSGGLIPMQYRTGTSDANLPARPQVRCWPNTPARSLTIVRLDDGRIIRSFRGRTGDYPTALAPVVGDLAPLNSPITGQPAAFPGGTGVIADRLFVGDYDGVVWRVDVSSTDPRNWKMKRFFDAYTGKPALSGQPIQTPPSISTDNAGQVTVAFSTGDQEARGSSLDMLTYVWTVRERLTTGVSLPTAEALWSSEFSGGERVTGPISLFSGVVYFSSFKPQLAGSSLCGSGESRIWGMDYVERKDPSDYTKGGKARLPKDESAAPELVQYIDNSSKLVEPGASLFGVTVSQAPSCYADEAVADPFFGSGTHSSVSNVTPGNFQLVMQTSKSSTNATGGTTQVKTINLPTPPNTPIIESWAAIVE